MDNIPKIINGWFLTAFKTSMAIRLREVTFSDEAFLGFSRVADDAQRSRKELLLVRRGLVSLKDQMEELLGLY